MKKGLALCAFVFCARLVFAQDKVDLVENTLKIEAKGQVVFYYGLAEGDEMILNFEEVNGKELHSLEIAELPSTIRFAENKVAKIKKKALLIPKTGIYRFTFSNTSQASRTCKFKLQRIPATIATQQFNTSVFFRTVNDTLYTPFRERVLVKSDTNVLECVNSIPQISSRNAFNGNKNYQIIDTQIPENTISWSYYIGSGTEGQKAADNAQAKFLQSAIAVASKIPEYGNMAALALTGVSYFSKIQGEDNVKFSILNDSAQLALLQADQPFASIKSGDVLSEAVQMREPLSGKIYIVLWNDNLIEPIKVTVMVTAVTVNQVFEDRMVQKMHLEARQEPYLEN